MDSDAKMIVHHSHGTSRPRIKCWIMRQLIFTIQLSKKNLPHCPKQNRGIAKEKKSGGVCSYSVVTIGLLVRFCQRVSSMLSEEGACYPHRNNLLQQRKRKRNL